MSVSSQYQAGGHIRMTPTIAIIGSFRKHLPIVLRLRQTLRRSGISVSSPLGTKLIRRDLPFVRFTTDDPDHLDAQVQSATLKRIFSADGVYVVAPHGYVGRTTCYEIGRVIQRRQPIYFSERPDDLPVWVPDTHIIDEAALVRLSLANELTWPYSRSTGPVANCERFLVE
jgi:hypothetical protein